MEDNRKRRPSESSNQGSCEFTEPEAGGTESMWIFTKSPACTLALSLVFLKKFLNVRTSLVPALGTFSCWVSMSNL